MKIDGCELQIETKFEVCDPRRFFQRYLKRSEKGWQLNW